MAFYHSKLICCQKVVDATLGKKNADGLYLAYCSFAFIFVSGSRCLPYLEKFNLLSEGVRFGLSQKKIPSG